MNKKIGEWIPIPSDDDYDKFKCSLCGHIAEDQEMFGRFCPWCESIMIPYSYPVEEFGNLYDDGFDDWED